MKRFLSAAFFSKKIDHRIFEFILIVKTEKLTLQEIVISISELMMKLNDFRISFKRFLLAAIFAEDFE